MHVETFHLLSYPSSGSLISPQLPLYVTYTYLIHALWVGLVPPLVPYFWSSHKGVFTRWCLSFQAIHQVAQKLDHESFSCNPNVNNSYSSFGLILTSCSPKEIHNESGWQLWSGLCDYFGWICQISVLQWFSLHLISALLSFEIILAVSLVCAPVVNDISLPVTSSSTSQIIFSFPPLLIV